MNSVAETGWEVVVNSKGADVLFVTSHKAVFLSASGVKLCPVDQIWPAVPFWYFAVFIRTGRMLSSLYCFFFVVTVF